MHAVTKMYAGNTGLFEKRIWLRSLSGIMMRNLSHRINKVRKKYYLYLLSYPFRSKISSRMVANGLSTYYGPDIAT